MVRGLVHRAGAQRATDDVGEGCAGQRVDVGDALTVDEDAGPRVVALGRGAELREPVSIAELCDVGLRVLGNGESVLAVDDDVAAAVRPEHDAVDADVAVSPEAVAPGGGVDALA